MKEPSNKQWTFGIVSAFVDIDNLAISNLGSVMDSIINLNIPKADYEIIVVGANSAGCTFVKDNIKFINFDETIKNKWITKKKNIIAEEARFENVVIVHDYVLFASDWYEGYQTFDGEWDVSMCKILNKDGVRWRDWVMWWNAHAPYRLEHKDILLAPNRLLYDDDKYVNTEMYISGTVIISKKLYLMANKLDERLVWGQGEDCEWSARCRPTWNYKMNTNSTLQLLKQCPNI